MIDSSIFLKKCRANIKLIIEIKNEFGFEFAVEYAINKIMCNTNRYISTVNKILEPYILRALDSAPAYVHGKMPERIPVWVFWWQGYDAMPPICKVCFESLKKNLPYNADLILLTRDNYAKYVNVPQLILKKIDQKIYSLTIFSDWLRNALITQYGGFWIDSTIYCAKKIDGDFLRDGRFWSIKLMPDDSDKLSIGRTVSKRMWGGFIQKAAQGNKISSVILSGLTEYMIEHDVLAEYFMQNMMIRTLYDKEQDVHEAIDSIPYSNPMLYELDKLMNVQFESRTWEHIISNTTFFKLSWKKQYELSTEDGNDTFYAYLMNKECKFNSQ